MLGLKKFNWGSSFLLIMWAWFRFWSFRFRNDRGSSRAPVGSRVVQRPGSTLAGPFFSPWLPRAFTHGLYTCPSHSGRWRTQAQPFQARRPLAPHRRGPRRPPRSYHHPRCWSSEQCELSVLFQLPMAYDALGHEAVPPVAETIYVKPCARTTVEDCSQLREAEYVVCPARLAWVAP